MTQPREPLFNVPTVVVATLGALALVHITRAWLISPASDQEILGLFAFFPVRYEPSLLPRGVLPGGLPAAIWTFVTYAFLHADWMHLGMNAIWLLAFGTPLARRFGSARFLAFLAVTAAAGALAHLITHAEELVPVIGASAAVAGAMAASMRFAFQRGGPIFRRGDEEGDRVPALSLGAALSDPRILLFIAVWFGINLIFGLGAAPMAGADQSIAWEAHVGGFLAGLLLFGLFDPVRPPADRNITGR